MKRGPLKQMYETVVWNDGMKQGVWDMYEKQEFCFWRAKEIDLSKDLKHWEKLSSARNLSLHISHSLYHHHIFYFKHPRSIFSENFCHLNNQVCVKLLYWWSVRRRATLSGELSTHRGVGGRHHPTGLPHTTSPGPMALALVWSTAW